MYKMETHTHTYPVSSCSQIAPRDMIKRYKQEGYRTVFIANHFAEFHFHKLAEKLGGNLSFERYVELFLNAYEEAKDEGEKQGINVLFSAELTLQNNHYLLYGISKEWMLKHPDIFSFTIAEFSAIARDEGITVIQAHPFRKGKIRNSTPEPLFVDGMEAVNSNPEYENYDQKVFEVAQENRLFVTAGSDTHKENDYARSAVLTDTEIETVEDYLEAIKSGKAKLMKNGEIVK